MLIVEGPDGSGKTTLVKALAEALDWPGGRAGWSTPRPTPLTDLRVWTEDNVASGWQEMIFDRHRLLSEPVYGPILKTSSNRGELYDPTWQSRMYHLLFETEPLVVYCLPPLEEVLSNLDGDEKNQVVFGHADAIYRAYVAQQFSLRNALPTCCLPHPVRLHDQTDKRGRGPALG
jgi:hypothetical protein